MGRMGQTPLRDMRRHRRRCVLQAMNSSAVFLKVFRRGGGDSSGKEKPILPPAFFIQHICYCVQCYTRYTMFVNY